MAGTRDRILTTTGELLRRQGYAATGLKQVITGAGVTFGSLYHFFPGGKEELAEAVLRTSGQAYLDLFVLIWDAAPSPPQAVTDFFEGAADVLEQTGYTDACPIGTVALEVASTSERLRAATADVFATWTAAATSRFTAAGLPATRARELALALIAGLEGGFMLSRAARSTEPLRTAGRLLREAVEASFDAVTAAPPGAGH